MDHNLLKENITRYVDLPENDWLYISSMVQERSFRKGDFITREGEISRFTNLIELGSARVYHIDESGNEHVIQLGVRGWWLGDFASFINQTKGKLYTEALENTDVLSLSAENIQAIYERIPVFERFYRLLIQKAYASFQGRVLENLSLDAEKRYVTFSERYPQLDEQISQKHIASYLGMSAEFLSKIKKRIHQKRKRGGIRLEHSPDE